MFFLSGLIHGDENIRAVALKAKKANK